MDKGAVVFQHQAPSCLIDIVVEVFTQINMGTMSNKKLTTEDAKRREKEANKRKETRLRKPARNLFLERLSERGGWLDWIRGFEDEPLTKLLINGVKGLRRDVETGVIVYSDAEHIGKRRLQDRVRKHLFPILKTLPIDIRMIESLELRNPSDYLRIEKEIEESSEVFWDFWSNSQNRVADALVDVIRAVEMLQTALSVPIRFCRMCPRQTTDKTSDFCKEHHPKISPANYMAARRKANKSGPETAPPWMQEIAFISLWHAKRKPSVKVSDASEEDISKKLNHFMTSSWPKAKACFLESLKTELPFVYKKVSASIEKTGSWKEAIKKMGSCLDDQPPETEDSTIVFSWLRALELCFNAEHETKQTKSEKVKEMLSKGFKQSEVAKELGVSRQLVSRIARQISPLP